MIPSLPGGGHFKGAQAVALAVFLARSGASRQQMRSEIATRLGYDLERTVAAIRPTYNFDVAAQRSVPEAILCFLDAQDFEGAVQDAISLGGDADTIACIAGAIAEAHWGEVPPAIATEVRKRLPPEFLQLLDRFRTRFGLSP